MKKKWNEHFIKKQPYIDIIKNSLGAMLIYSDKAPKGNPDDGYIDPRYEYKIKKCKRRGVKGYILKWRLKQLNN